MKSYSLVQHLRSLLYSRALVRKTLVDQGAIGVWVGFVSITVLLLLAVLQQPPCREALPLGWRCILSGERLHIWQMRIPIVWTPDSCWCALPTCKWCSWLITVIDWENICRSPSNETEVREGDCRSTQPLSFTPQGKHWLMLCTIMKFHIPFYQMKMQFLWSVPVVHLLCSGLEICKAWWFKHRSWSWFSDVVCVS